MQEEKEENLVDFGDLKTGEYFRTVSNPPIWSDSFVYRKNDGLVFPYNSYVFNGPPNYCGINMNFSNIGLVRRLKKSEINLPTSTLNFENRLGFDRYGEIS